MKSVMGTVSQTVLFLVDHETKLPFKFLLLLGR